MIPLVPPCFAPSFISCAAVLDGIYKVCLPTTQSNAGNRIRRTTLSFRRYILTHPLYHKTFNSTCQSPETKPWNRGSAASRRGCLDLRSASAPASRRASPGAEAFSALLHPLAPAAILESGQRFILWARRSVNCVNRCCCDLSSRFTAGAKTAKNGTTLPLLPEA